MSNVAPEDCVLSHGVLATGNIVGVPVHDDRARAELVEAMLHAKLRREIFAVTPDCRFRTWLDRSELHGPSGEFRGVGYRICLSVRPPISKELRGSIEAVPNEYQQLEVWCHEWSDEPPQTME